MTTLVEICACGSSITITTEFASDAGVRVQDWRLNHVCSVRQPINPLVTR